jgi:hypothetical protein
MMLLGSMRLHSSATMPWHRVFLVEPGRVAFDRRRDLTMSGTISAARSRTSAVVSAIGIVLLTAGVVAAIIVTMVSAASGPMPVLAVHAYTSYVWPASSITNPYGVSDTMVLVAFGVAAVGLVALVLGVALHATRRHPR